MTLNFSAREPKARSIMYFGINDVFPLKYTGISVKGMRISNSALNLSPGKNIYLTVLKINQKKYIILILHSKTNIT